jgi:preprotein translocase subunit SecA
MHLDAEIFYDRYPIRDAGGGAQLRQYWRSPHKKNVSRLIQLCNSAGDTQAKPESHEINEVPKRAIDSYGKINLTFLAESFRTFQTALSQVHGLSLSDADISAAYGLFERRIEVLRSRSDRVLVAGLAAAAFVQSGVRVHLICDKSYQELVKQHLLPVLDCLEISIGVVATGDDEAKRHVNYACDITLVSARECAMDFLRDSVNWPKRGNAAHRVVDRLLGRRAKHPHRIMSGLPCAIHLDAQSALIDNARAPIVLTQDAHPMHEIEELQRALELAQEMTLAQDYIYSGKELEIAYTVQGKQKIEAWAKEFGGIWLVPSVADLMIAISLVVQNIVHKGQHYQISNGLLEWLVPDHLVPGMRYYLKPFLTRIVELQNECALTGQQEVVGRASYQHVFNRYIHLCGMSHAAGLACEELRDVYQLRSENSKNTRLNVDETILLNDSETKFEYLIQFLHHEDRQKMCTFLCTGVNEDGDSLNQIIQGSGCATQYYNNAEHLSKAMVAEGFDAKDVVLINAEVLSSMADEIWNSLSMPYEIVFLNRSVDWYEDSLITQFDQCDLVKSMQRVQLLSLDEEVFQNHPLTNLSRLYPYAHRLGGWAKKFFQFLLELRIRSIQKQVAQESYSVRRNLLTHDQGMQSMLSFSGKGLYE